jgi:hypothetical protein
MRKALSAMPSFIDCLTAFVLAGVFVFLLAALSVVADGSGGSASPTVAFAAAPSSHFVSRPDGLQSTTERTMK